MPSPDANSTADLDQLGFLLGRAYYSYITLLQSRLDDVGLGTHLRPGMGSLLFALFREDDRSLAALAAELQLAKSTMTDMVARMRQAGLVAAEPDESDARAVRLRLTPLAKSLRPRCTRLAAEMEELLGESLTGDERETFRRALKSVAATIAGKLEAGTAASRRASLPPKRRASKRRDGATRSPAARPASGGEKSSATRKDRAGRMNPARRKRRSPKS